MAQSNAKSVQLAILTKLKYSRIINSPLVTITDLLLISHLTASIASIISIVVDKAYVTSVAKHLLQHLTSNSQCLVQVKGVKVA